MSLALLLFIAGAVVAAVAALVDDGHAHFSRLLSLAVALVAAGLAAAAA